MAQKSTYLQAPYTQDALVQTIKDGYAIVGADTVQNSDLSYVYDSDYWISKVKKTSTVNLMGESEVLIYPEAERTVNDAAYGSSSFYGMGGANTYVKQNSDTNYPFKLSNYINPRPTAGDSYLQIRMPVLDAAKKYTYSFYAKKSDGNSFNNLPLLLRNSGTANYITRTHVLSSQWQRFSGTFTPTSQNMDILFGGYGTWGNGVNYVPYSEYAYNWNFQSGFTADFLNYDTPIPSTYYRATKVTNNSGNNNLAYVYMGANIGSSVANRTFTFTVYAKLVSGAPKLVISDAGADNSNTAGSVTLIDTVGEWKRYSLTYTFGSNTSSSSINVHVGMVGGDSAILWGWCLSEGSTAMSYTPTMGSAKTATIYIGDLELAGLQLEQAESATSYSPVTNWAYIPYETPVVVNNRLDKESFGIHTFIPGGVVTQAFNVIDNEHTYYGAAISNHSSSYQKISSTRVNAVHQAYEGMTSSWIGVASIVDTDSAFCSSGQGTTCAYASDAVKVPTRNAISSSANSILGSRMIAFAQSYRNPTFVPTAKFTINGTLFKLSDKAQDFGLPAGKVRSVVFNVKTPGNGKRKQLCYTFVNNDSNNTTSVIYVPNLHHTNVNGNAEAPPVLTAAVSAKKYYDLTGRSTEVGAYMNDVMPTTSVHFMDYVNLSRNSDVFNFIQGSSEGFVHAINVNSNFVFYTGAFDAVNQPIPGDDGTVSSRTFILATQPGTYNYYILNLGPSFSTYATLAGPYFSDIWSISGTAINPSYEVYGDSVDINKQIFPVYAGANSYYAASNRGQLKNLYMTTEAGFSGSIGDMYIASDNSRYFCFSKRAIMSSSGYGIGNYALFVKV